MDSLKTLVTTWEFWNFLIAILALFISLYSVWYTRKNDKHSIEIVSCYIEQVKNRPTMIWFDILNDSTSSIKLLNVELFFNDGKPVIPVDYEPEQTYCGSGMFSVLDILSPTDYAQRFDGETILGPHSKEEFRYYLESFSQDLKIKVTCDRPIKGFRKSKLIPVHFKKFD